MQLLPDGVVVKATSTEPSVYTDGSPLENLAQIRFYWKLEDEVGNHVTDVPATSPTGGGQAVALIKVPVLPCEHKKLYVQAAAKTQAGAESAPSAATPVNINRKSECKPKPPSRPVV